MKALKLNQKKLLKGLTTTAVTAMMVGLFIVPAFAADDTVFSVAQEMMNDTRVALVAISTAAAVVGAGTGALMKKFSMGNEHKISTGNKVITGSVVGWGVINGLPLLLNTLGNYF